MRWGNTLLFVRTSPLRKLFQLYKTNISDDIMSRKSVTTAEARREFAEIVNRVAYGKERITVTRRGKTVVAVVPIEDIALLEELEDHADIQAARKAIKEKGSISLDELIAKHG